MNIFSYIAIIFLIFISPWVKEVKLKKTDAEKMNLKGNVYQIHESCFLAVLDNESIVKGNKKYPFGTSYDQVWTFNKKGNILLEELIDNDGNIYTYTVYFYKNEQLKETRSLSANNGLLSQDIYYPDYKNNSIKRMKIGPFQKVATKLNKYFYDEEGKLLNEIDSSSNFYINSICEYNEYGQLTKVTEKDEIKTETTISEYFYNNKKDLLPITEKIYNSELYRYYNYEYDKYGNILYTTGFNKDSEKIYDNSFSYEYDSKGNWTKKIQYESNIPKYIYERIIIY